MGATKELRTPSGFEHAFYEYIRNLPEKKSKRSILARLDLNNPPTPEDIQESLRQIETRHAQKPSIKIMKRVLGPVVAVLKDYYGVVDTLSQADPTPGCVLWGVLKVAIDGLSRFIDLIDKIKAEVLSLSAQLRRLTLYDELYGQSLDMQELLFSSYKNVFRFWSRVDKECSRCGFNALLRASTSFSIKKLQDIVDDLKEDADQIEKVAAIIEGQYAGSERMEASLERCENRKERDDGSAWRRQMQSDRIRSWLGGQTINESTLHRHRNNLDVNRHATGSPTCEWLFKDSHFQDWVKGTSSKPILWLFAGPGSGKSVLCSHAIEYVRNLGDTQAQCLHFYEFDNEHTAIVTARNLATQLFERYWLLNQDVPEDLQITSQKSSADLINVFEFMRILVGKLPKVYIFLDGLDEECTVARWKEASKIVESVNLLAETSAKTVRVWYSSQDRPIIRQYLESHLVLNVKEQIRVAVDEHISLKVPGICNPEVDQDTRTWILSELKQRADGNFLWATLMLKTIENEVSSFDEMELFIKEGLPKDLDAYYRRIIARYEKRERELASKIFSLITFARRRLRLTELREAIGIISSENPRSLQNRNIPWRQAVEKIFAPLIETQSDPENQGERFCFLFHSTVRDFLIRNQSIFQQESPSPTIHSISELTIANACLLYLSQNKYAQLLTRDAGQWLTTFKENIKDHHLVTYSAKYWDKHFDHVEETPELRQKIEDFLTSSNFQSTIQLQSLFVQGHFDLYTTSCCSPNHKFTKRVFPKWFASHDSDGYSQFAKNYRSYISEWHNLLDCANCEEPRCYTHSAVKQLAGELDRCLWGALGPRNFLSRNSGRYTSFMLCDEGDGGSGKMPYHEAISQDGSKLVVFQPSGEPADAADFTFHHKTWNLPDREVPALLEVNTTISASLDQKRRADADLKSISFTPDLHFLRIGFQMFSVNSGGEYHAIDGLDIVFEHPNACFEDITSRDSLLVVASRRKMPASTEPRGRAAAKADQPTMKALEDTGNPLTDKSFGKDLSATQCRHCSREPSKSNHASDTSPAKGKDSSEKEENDSDSSNSSEEISEWNSAEESWSEGSTEIDGLGNPLTSSDESSSNSSEADVDTDEESETPKDDAASDTAVNSYGQLYDESDSDGGDVDFDCGSEEESYDGDYESDWSSDNNQEEDLHFDSDDEERLVRRMAYSRQDRKRDAKVQQGVLTVYDLATAPPTQIFTFTHQLPVMLYDSPPAIHPKKPLVVWPLYGGDVLFADFEGKSYFIRRARTTTRKTRHVFMKFHFSPCCKYLHIASLEAQQMKQSRSEIKAGTKPHLALSAFISTHRLSTRKTTRSPPTLIHRVKTVLGSTTSLCPTRMPVEVTWAEKEVYLSSSSDSNQLTVVRVDLFPPAPDVPTAEYNAVSVPRLPILLPESARSRSVHYYPPQPNTTHALIIIGSWACNPDTDDDKNNTTPEDAPNEHDTIQGLPDTVSPPIGFYVDVEKDLGGWGASNAEEVIDKDKDKGQLKQKMEIFAGEDDCDLEHYFFTRRR
ncbi:hypothetical protein HO133_006924 [Letharia lupina]|uniref:NACHT domain-containing protein n=1 Tax=Letharia lupina TaxID=560253 RepID=A0A8H6C4K2_9LECA|nr:uncharacterized protein HO133_006924 [Letharia lupina]KAF6217408.1 hypothetical protein HO133_006924 [Letharia lupina]